MSCASSWNLCRSCRRLDEGSTSWQNLCGIGRQQQERHQTTQHLNVRFRQQLKDRAVAKRLLVADHDVCDQHRPAALGLLRHVLEPLTDYASKVSPGASVRWTVVEVRVVPRTPGPGFAAGLGWKPCGCRDEVLRSGRCNHYPSKAPCTA